MCDRANFPLRPVEELSGHTGEVWDVKFSFDGQKLATCGSDGFLIIFDVPTWGRLWRLPLGDPEPNTQKGKGICSLAWSPDNTKIVTCGQDKKARIWHASNGSLIRTINRFGEPVSSCAWAPDGRTFVTGCLDKEKNLVQWTDSGELVYDWGRSHRIQDLAISPDGNRLIAMDHNNQVHVYNLLTKGYIYSTDFESRLSSIEISADSRFLLVNRTDGEAQLYDLESRSVVKKYTGAKGGEYVIRASFGGANESFVVAGSEDGRDE